RSFIAGISEESSALPMRRDSKASPKRGALPSRTISSATTASISRWPWPRPLRLPRPQPMRSARPTPRRHRTYKPILNRMTSLTLSSQRTAPESACKAAAATQRVRSPPRALAPVAARHVGKSVTVVLPRKMMFQSVGHRPRSQQRVRLGATPEGKLVSIQHDYVYERSMLDAHHEDCGEATPFQYSVPNLRVTFGRSKRNIGAGADMRGPGRVPGLYATESAMNELAEQLKIDPVKLRILTEPRLDESLGVPFSSRHLVECFDLGAQIGRASWRER